jgi:type VII secretion effector (TIGR04197 family)
MIKYTIYGKMQTAIKCTLLKGDTMIRNDVIILEIKAETIRNALDKIQDNTNYISLDDYTTTNSNVQMQVMTEYQTNYTNQFCECLYRDIDNVTQISMVFEELDCKQAKSMSLGGSMNLDSSMK